MENNNKSEPLMFIETNIEKTFNTQNQIEYDSRFKSKKPISDKKTTDNLLINKLSQIRNISFYCTKLFLKIHLKSNEILLVDAKDVTRVGVSTSDCFYTLAEINDVEIEKIIL